MKNKIISIIGGTGFVGTQITKDLLKAGFLVQVITRDTQKNLQISTAATPGQLYYKKCNIADQNQLEESLKSSYAVINLVGILFEKGKNNFYNLHTLFPARLGKICKKLKIKHLIHFSSLGVDKAFASSYARSKIQGEKNLLEENKESIIIRPSVIFGANDDFTNRFKTLLKISPFFPLIRDGKTKFQPVYVGDLSNGICKILDNPEKYHGQIFEFGGSEIISMKDILLFIKDQINSKSLLLDVPIKMIKFCAYFMEFLNKPPLTRDQIRLLTYHNFISSNSKNKNFDTLGVSTVDFKTKVKEYII